MIDKLNERINKGNAAKRVLEDEMVNEVLSEIGSDWTAQAINNCFGNPDTSVALLRHIVALEEVKSRLKAVVANGREAERELQRLNPT